MIRRRSWLLAVVAAVMVVASGGAVVVGRPWAATPARDPPMVLEPNATVAHVVDGDTVVARVDGHDEHVRLIGVDTPETVDPDRPVMCFGP